MIDLFDLVTHDGTPMSPYVWRVKFALAHKGLDFRTIPVGFVDIPTLLDGSHKTVPIIKDGNLVVSDSWRIAEYVDGRYPSMRLFVTPAEHAMVRLFDRWFTSEVLSAAFRVLALDIHRALRPADQLYFRNTRERRLGVSLESMDERRGENLKAFQKKLQPIRAHLADGSAFLGGQSPNYADYIGFGLFRWVAAVTSAPVLPTADPLVPWVGRAFEMYGGLGHPASHHHLFG